MVRCLGCGKTLVPAGKAMHCRCGGAWLAESVLGEMASHVRGAIVKLPWRERSGPFRGCPLCAMPMQTVELGGVQLDRCAPHGIWFDAHELDVVLHQSKGFPLAATTPQVEPMPRMKRPSLDLLSDLRGAFFNS